MARTDFFTPLYGTGWGGEAGEGVSGEGAWSGGRGFATDNPKQIKLFHTLRYTAEECAADSQGCAHTAARACEENA